MKIRRNSHCRNVTPEKGPESECSPFCEACGNTHFWANLKNAALSLETRENCAFLMVSYQKGVFVLKKEKAGFGNIRAYARYL